MAGTTSLYALPYPTSGDANNVPADMLALANRLEVIGPGVGVFTTTARDALSGINLWTGRLIYNSTLGRFQVYRSAAWADVAATFYSVMTWAIAGEIKVAVTDTDFLVPSPVAEGTLEVVTLDKVVHKINAGTSATVKMQVNGSDATGFTGMSVTTTKTTTDPTDVALNDLDVLAPVVTAVSSTPKNLYVAAYIKHVVTVV